MLIDALEFLNLFLIARDWVLALSVDFLFIDDKMFPNLGHKFKETHTSLMMTFIFWYFRLSLPNYRNFQLRTFLISFFIQAKIHQQSHHNGQSTFVKLIKSSQISLNQNLYKVGEIPDLWQSGLGKGYFLNNAHS